MTSITNSPGSTEMAAEKAVKDVSRTERCNIRKSIAAPAAVINKDSLKTKGGKAQEAKRGSAKKSRMSKRRSDIIQKSTIVQKEDIRYYSEKYPEAYYSDLRQSELDEAVDTECGFRGSDLEDVVRSDKNARF